MGLGEEGDSSLRVHDMGSPSSPSSLIGGQTDSIFCVFNNVKRVGSLKVPIFPPHYYYFLPMVPLDIFLLNPNVFSFIIVASSLALVVQ